MSDSLPDYYAVLGVKPESTPIQIKTGYKKAALASHPDRFPGDANATRRFQLVNEAFYTLSDVGRRAEYDRARAEQARRTGSSTGWGSWSRPDPRQEQPAYEEDQFADAFEEMMNEENINVNFDTSTSNKFWSLAGGASGAVLGFIVGNVPGLLAGAVVGNRLGAIRERNQRSVYEVYQSLPADHKARILADLAQNFMHLAGGK
ncbi:DnaJ-domain-containing protein [Saitoella complicata NRRL Y-17804]|uniref:J domain-containing protein n=1 Tax=Saitoella complicata (strain BCRC 22490 / CBS 7301 / JCM 7358 / NBRC 10748 / NRRL Y-17804) TaxID=698492 RepID=A0A0E9NQX0_SAICN|nr:DnaJ-domain-containing protein [Saitoella complicata NRRL Y-17804]ODQ51696.1 DnaJ-domain-containing protein [Saitoella complicata NRRL Y-17804]GAO52254.1 hypothetical protein G7K_6335-t1 [Saitoella complicata NRRL Y-17804]